MLATVNLLDREGFLLIDDVPRSILFSAMSLPSCRAASMCAGLAPPLEPQKTQILARGVPLVVPLVVPLGVPFWPAMGVLEDMVICLVAC